MKVRFKDRTLYVLWFKDIRYSLLPKFRNRGNGNLGFSIPFGKYVLRVDLIAKRKPRSKYYKPKSVKP